MPRTNKILLDNRPERRGHGQQLQARHHRHPAPAGRPGAGAPPLPEPGPLHARAHERRQELRPAAAAGRGDAGRHGGRGGRESKNPSTAVGDKVVGMGGWQEYSVVERRPARRAAQGGHHPRAAEPLPGRGGHAGRDRLVRPGQDHRAQGRRDRGGQRRHRRGGQRLWRPGQGARLPRGGHCRRPRQVQAYVVDELGFDACIDYKEHKRPSLAVQGAQGRPAQRHRRLLRERGRHGSWTPCCCA
jgi:hypothetical protein